MVFLHQQSHSSEQKNKLAALNTKELLKRVEQCTYPTGSMPIKESVLMSNLVCCVSKIEERINKLAMQENLDSEY